MGKTKKILAILFMVMLFMAILTVNAKASVSTSVVFDAEFYLNNYADLRAAYGNDYEAAYNHYLTYGIKEGRQASPLFDVRYYISYYEDLQAAYGDDYESAYNHFLTYGIKEGRRSSYEFDVKYYISQYEDLQVAFSDDYESAYNHAVAYGMSEGRVTSADFNVRCYINGYEDLKAAFETNWTEGFTHYYLFGANEGRHTTHNAVKIEAVEATCTEAGSTEGSCCEYCGEIFSEPEEVPATGHTYAYYEEAGGEYHIGICSNCEEDTEGHTSDPIAHEYKVIDMEDGTHTYVCSVCSYIGSNEEHSSTTEPISTTEATCTEAATETYTCDVCGAEYTVTVGEALGHDYVEEVITEATCTEAGEVTYTCSVCGDSYTDEMPVTEHEMTKVEAVEATCTEDGTVEYYVCANEEGVYYVDEEGSATYSEEELVVSATGHSYVEEVTTEATCTEAGEITYTCSACGDSYTEEIAATGHNLEEVADEDRITTSPTCTTDGYNEYYCTNCGIVYVTKAEATGHSYELTSTTATCTESGVETYTCTVCGEPYEVEVAASHTVEEWTEVDATCATEGYRVGNCSVCGLAVMETIEKTDHSWDEGEVTTEATCTEAGEITYTCSVCESTYTEEVVATGHSMTKVEAVEATCTENGTVEYYVCANEEGVYYVDEEGSATYSEEELVVPATGHSYVEEVTTEATCTEAGEKTYTCSACGDSYTEEIAATGHTYSIKIDVSTLGNSSSATCTEPGYVAYQCENCDSVEITYSEEALGHSMTKVEAVEATCTEDGTVEYYVCANEEGVYYVDEEGSATYSEEELVVPATGHSYEYYEEVGEYHIGICSNCDEETEGHTTEAIAHEYNVIDMEDGTHTYICSVCSYIGANEEHSSTTEPISTTEATCTEAATETYTCDVCGAEYTVTVGEATGHDYVEEVITEATCTETGEVTYTCSVCGDSYTEEIVATGHNMTKVEAVEATCTEDGTVEYYVCANEEGVYYVDEEGSATYSEEELVVPATGHSSTTDPISTTEATCTEATTETYTCDVCGAEYTVTVGEATGHAYTYEFGWSEDYTSATYEGVCENDESHTDTVEAEVEVITTEATCEEDGSIVYTATATIDEETYTDTYTDVIKATGHSYPDEVSVSEEYTSDVNGVYSALYYKVCEVCGDIVYYLDSEGTEEVEVIEVASEEELISAIETVTADTETSYVILITSDVTTSDEIDVSSVTVFVNVDAKFYIESVIEEETIENARYNYRRCGWRHWTLCGLIGKYNMIRIESKTSFHTFT